MRLSQPECANAGDHRRVVLLIRVDHAAGQQTADGGQRRLVGDEAGGEQERCRLAVQARELALEQDVQVRGAGDVARAAGAGAHAAHRLDRGVQHHRMLAHAQIVVGAPHRDRLRIGVGMGVARGARKRPRLTRQIAEHAVAALAPDPLHRALKDLLVVHHPPPAAAAARTQTSNAQAGRARAPTQSPGHQRSETDFDRASIDGLGMTCRQQPGVFIAIFATAEMRRNPRASR